MLWGFGHSWAREHCRLAHRAPLPERLSMAKHEVFSWRQCRWLAGGGRGPGEGECVSEGLGGGWTECQITVRVVGSPGHGNGRVWESHPGKSALLWTPTRQGTLDYTVVYMARRRLKHMLGADRCQSLTLPAHGPGFPLHRDSVPGEACVCRLPGARRVGRGRIPRSVCFVSSMQPHLAVGLSVCRPSV